MVPPPPTSALVPYTTLFRSRALTRTFDADDLVQVAALHCGEPVNLEDGQQDTEHVFLRDAARRLHRHLAAHRSEEHTSELQSPDHLVCRLLLEKKKMHAQPP